MSNLQTSLRQNQTSVSQLDRDSFQQLNSQNQYSTSVMSFVYIYLIGIVFSIFIFLIEFFRNWCSVTKKVPLTSNFDFFKNI